MDSSDNMVQEVSVCMAPITQVDNQDFTSIQLEHPLDPYHPSARVAELEAQVQGPRVDLETPTSALEMWLYSVVLACHMDNRAVFPGQMLDLEA